MKIGTLKWHRMAAGFLLAVAVLVLARPGEGNATPPHPNTHVKNVTFVAFDVETTGLSPYQERVIEIGAVKFRNGEIIEEREWLIKPDRPIHPMAQRTHNISMDELKDSPAFKDIYDEFMAFIDGSVLMAHNARFDVDFIREEMLRNDLPLPDAPVVDSLRSVSHMVSASPLPCHGAIDGTSRGRGRRVSSGLGRRRLHSRHIRELD
jgi:DNA polymerase III epsilon subunit-like protein